LAVGETKFDHEVAALDIASLSEPLAKRNENALLGGGVG
jgi:hypothetical protein